MTIAVFVVVQLAGMTTVVFVEESLVRGASIAVEFGIVVEQTHISHQPLDQLRFAAFGGGAELSELFLERRHLHARQRSQIAQGDGRQHEAFGAIRSSLGFLGGILYFPFLLYLGHHLHRQQPETPLGFSATGSR